MDDSNPEVALLRNYITITIRNMQKHKFYAGLNVLGLAIGLTCCMLILVYVSDEVSYDRFHKRASEIYRLNWDFSWNGNEGVGPGTPPPLAAALLDNIPEVEATTRIYPVQDMIVRIDDKFFNETRILGVDPNFFDIFSFQLMEGNPKTALDEPGSVILTQKTAKKYFGGTPALGKRISIGVDKEFLGTPYSSSFKVTGIVQKPPHNSHIEFDLLTSMSSHPQVTFFDWSWVWMQVVTYAVVDKDVSVKNLEAKIVDMVAELAPQAFERIGFSYSDLISKGGRWNFVFQPLTEIYLGSRSIGNRVGPTGNATTLAIFALIALFILMIACINFMNLATARSTKRAREVGVRKVLGSVRRDLVTQFMTESLLFSLLAMLLAVGLTEVLLEPFGQLAGKHLEFSLSDPPWLPASLLLLTLVVGVVSGSYPSLYLSSFKPILVLQGKIGTEGKNRHGLRNGLVVLQFAVSTTLVICTLIVHNQMQFFRQADMGFDKDGILVISNQNDRLGSQAETFRDAVRRRAQVVDASLSTGVPPRFGFEDFYKVEGKGEEQFDLISYMVDENFVTTLGIQIVQGRGFSKQFGANADGVLLNQNAVQRFGWKDPIGKIITYPGQGDYKVIGILKDFNFMTLNQPILPFALFHRASKSYTIPDSYVVLRIQRNDMANTLKMLENEWATLAPNTPFEYSFLDENLENEYQAEARLGTIFLIFAGLAILIACLGLLGLAAFASEKRTKEIGVRKTLGASTTKILILLTRDFAKWVLVANCVAWPIAWYVMNQWLQGFAYRIEIGFGVFLVAGAAALVVALLTVAYQALKAATANPVEALKYE